MTRRLALALLIDELRRMAKSLSLQADESGGSDPMTLVRGMIRRGSPGGSIHRDRLIVLNMGLGRDSMAMLALLAEGELQAEGHKVRPQDIDAIVFSDPGMEWDHTYAAVADVERVLEKIRRSTGVFVPFFILAKPPPDAWKSYLESLHEARGARGAEGDRSHEEHRVWRHALEGRSIEEKAAGGYYHLAPPIDIHYSQGRPTPYAIQFGDTACTDNHKVQAILRFMSDLGKRKFGPSYSHASWSSMVRAGKKAPHLNLLGIAEGEGSDATGPRELHMHPFSVEREEQLDSLRSILRGRERRGLSSTKLEGKIRSLEAGGPYYTSEAYPLVELGISKEAEGPILRRHGLDHIKKSGCVFCHSQPPEWYWVLSHKASQGDRWARVSLQRVFDYERASFEHRDPQGRRGKVILTGSPWQRVDLADPRSKLLPPEDRRLLPEIIPLIYANKVRPRIEAYVAQGYSKAEATRRVVEDILSKDYAQGCTVGSENVEASTSHARGAHWSDL